MSWFKNVAEHIQRNLEDYARTFLNPQSVERSGKSITVNPCPFPSCGHNDCFTLTRGVNAGHCFSCKNSGSLINIVEQLQGEVAGRQALADWSGIKYNFASHTPQQAAAKEKYARFQQLCNHAVQFYQARLMNAVVEVDGEKVNPGTYQVEVRKHEYESLVKHKVGYSGGWPQLKEYLLKKGYTEEEIEEAKKEMIGFPDGFFLYPYYDVKGNLIRINAKLFVRSCFSCDYVTRDLKTETKKKHEAAHNHKMTRDNYSKGSKMDAFFFSPKELSGKKYLIIVEGENDKISTDEALKKLPPVYAKEYLVTCIGGNSPEGMFESDFLRRFESVYEAFDNDDGGDKYREQLDLEMPEVDLKHIDIPKDYNDIDEFLKLGPEDALEQFEEMLEAATTVPPKHYRITKEDKKHVWFIQNRHYGLKYTIESFKATKNSYMGTLQLYTQNIRGPKKNGDIDTITFPGNNEVITQLRSALSDAIGEFYHHAPWINNEPGRTFDDLLDIFKITKYKKDVMKQLAWYLYHAGKKEKDYKISRLEKVARNEKEVATVLQEMTGFDNNDIDLTLDYPQIHLSQSLFPKNNDAYMYFAMIVQDGEDTKRVPCLISNKKEIIRLDIMKKKEAQSMLLINKKYELPEEVEIAIVDTKSLSLQHSWVDKWVENKIEEEQTKPATIIAEIEAFIRMTYYTTPEIIKVVSLWIYATYYYRLFTSGFPYLMINGGKGTGKSTLDLIVNLLAFNPTFTVNTSEAALYRRIDFIGGTFILDELENLTDTKKVDDSGIAAVLKAGYSEAGVIMRVDPDTKHAKSFSAFGPKVISNIRGLEDVIADRCIRIDTVAGPENKLRSLKNPFDYKVEKRSQIYSITSRAAISALIHFQEADKIFQENTRIDTGNARLTQLLRPLVTIARLVGGDYEVHLLNYYETAIKEAKQEVQMTTLDGKLESILKEISEEFLGLVKENDKQWTNQQHIYDKHIHYDSQTETFEINAMHLKVYAQELDTEKIYGILDIHAAMKALLIKKRLYDKNNRRTTKATVIDENLLRQLNGTKSPNVQAYTLNVRDFVPKHTENLNYKDTTELLF